MIYSSSDWLIGIIIAGFTIAIYYLSDKSLSTRLFVLLSLFVSVWSFFIGIMELPTIFGSDNITIYSIQVSYFIGIIIADIFILFSISYPYNKYINMKYIYVLLIAMIIFFSLIFLTDTIIIQSSVFRS